MYNNKGFTLIELLAVILILGIIALIAIPTINDVVLESKKNSLRTSASNITTAIEQQCQLEKINDKPITIKYVIEKGKTSIPIGIKNLPESGIITVDNECNATVAIVDNDFCAIKKGDNTSINSNINNCTLENLNMEPTKDSCFMFDETTKTITGYNYSDDTCPNDVVIPNTINNIPVENIGDFAFTIIPSGYTPMYYMYEKNSGRNFKDIFKETANIINLELNTIEIIKIKDVTTKSCRYKDRNQDIKEPDYHITSSDNYIGCYINNYDTYNKLGSITSVDFTKANNLKTIGDGAFMNNKITNVYFDMNNTISHLGNSIFSNNLILNLNLKGLNYNKIPGGMFKKNAISKVIFNNNIISINVEAFAENNINEYKFPSSLLKIGGFAFDSNTGKTNNLDLPDNLEEIGEYSFYGNNIKNLKLGNNLRNIGRGAFEKSNLYTVLFNSKLENIGSSAFYNNNLSNIQLKSSLKNLGAEAFNKNQVINENDGMYFTKVENGISDPTVLVGVAAKQGLNLTLPNGIVTIAKGALMNNNFKNLTTPNTLKTIESFAIAFNFLKGAIIKISSSVTTIEDNAFYCMDSKYCQNFIKISKPENSIPGYDNKWGNSYANVTWNYNE